MKTIKYFVCILFLTISDNSYSQQPDYNYFSDIFLLDSLNIWLTEYNGKVWHTSDGGINWEIYESEINQSSMVFFINPSEGWRTSDKIYYSSNAGANWTVNFDPNPFNFRDLKFLNDSIGFATGFNSSSIVFRTTDAGSNWIEVFNSVVVVGLGLISILNEQNIWLSYLNAIYKTANLGESWETVYYDSVVIGHSLGKLKMFDEYSGIVGFHIDNYILFGRIMHTTDGGYSWNWYGSNQAFDFGLRDFYFPSILKGWVAAESRDILYTSNEGVSWDTLQNQETLPGSINKFAFIDQLKAWAITNLEILYTADGWYTFNVMGYITTVKDFNELIPDDFILHQNYPNPFNPVTKIKFRIPDQVRNDRSLVTLKVYDVLGNEIATLVNEEQTAGNHEVEFDGAELPSGIYFYQLKVVGPETSSGQVFIETKKMVLIK